MPRARSETQPPGRSTGTRLIRAKRGPIESRLPISYFACAEPRSRQTARPSNVAVFRGAPRRIWEIPARRCLAAQARLRRTYFRPRCWAWQSGPLFASLTFTQRPVNTMSVRARPDRRSTFKTVCAAALSKSEDPFRHQSSPAGPARVVSSARSFRHGVRSRIVDRHDVLERDLKKQPVFNHLFLCRRHRLIDAQNDALGLFVELGDELVEGHVIPVFLLRHRLVDRKHRNAQFLHLFEALLPYGRIVTAV